MHTSFQRIQPRHSKEKQDWYNIDPFSDGWLKGECDTEEPFHFKCAFDATSRGPQSIVLSPTFLSLKRDKMLTCEEVNTI